MTNLTLKDVSNFLEARAKYESQVQERNNGLPRGSQVIPVRLSSTISDGVLRTIKYRELRIGEDEEMPEEALMDFLSNFAPSVFLDGGFTELPRLLRARIVDPGNSYTPIERVRMMWTIFEDVSSKFNIQDEFKREKPLELLRTVFVEACRHPSLKRRLQLLFDSVSIHGYKACADLDGLYEGLMKCAKMQHLEDELNPQGSKNVRTKKRKMEVPETKEQWKKRKFGPSYIPPEHRGYHEVTGKLFDQRKKERKNNQKQGERRCFNCQGFGHMARECPSVRRDDMKNKKKVTNANHGKNESTARSAQEDNSRSKCVVVINGQLKLPALADSGASTTYISKSIAEKLKMNVFIASSGMFVKLATSGTRATIYGIAKGDLELHVESGQVMVRNVEFTVLEQDMDLVLIGNDVLTELGVNPLSSLNQRIKSKHYSYVF